jgi:xanthine dehydrogenase YagS FAD-binding subunit
MSPFDYAFVDNELAALDAAAAAQDSAFIAGGTDLMQLWKVGIMRPDLVIDISRLPLDAVEVRADGITIGALARMSDVAEHPLIRARAPAIAEALLASASPQIRNVATVGGNLLQRTRCPYFRGSALPCNRRRPGSGCAALHGENRAHAIFGASAHCAATHPSDLAVALVALDAVIRLRGQNGVRTLPVEEFFLLPQESPIRETALARDELIVAVEVPSSARAHRSHYLKVRDRASFDFAVVSVAVAMDVGDGVIQSAGIAAGGVGTKPWRLRACEAPLVGAKPGNALFSQAAERAADGARPLSQNGFKIALLKQLLHRALSDLGGEEWT